MPRVTSNYLPKYRFHKPSGQARVTIEGRDFWLGPWKSKASMLEYDRIITEWLANGRRLPAKQSDAGLTLVELIAAYLKHARAYYRKDGKETSEVVSLVRSLRIVKELYGKTAVAEFGPLKLKAVRQKMIDIGWCRNQINKHTQRIVRMFRWASEQELAPGTVVVNLQNVAGLRKGRTEAKESKPVLPVPDGDLQATLPHLPQVVADMVRFQRLTGCRPGEVCQLRPGDVDRSAGDVWTYRPGSHKTEHYDKDRVIFVGPMAQNVLRPYLLRPADAYCFSPRESEAKRRRLAHEARTTPMSCGNRPGNHKAKPKHPAGKCYTRETYWQAIARAVAKANKVRKPGEPAIERWAPNQLRHSAATEIRKRYGLEGAQVCLGHSAANVTQIYAERDMQKAAEIMREIG